MKEILFMLLQAVITAAVPVATYAICKTLAAVSEKVKASTTNETAKELLAEALEAVSTAVTYVNQTYVDTLKASGTFSTDNQKEAFEKAYAAAVQIMSQEAQTLIETAYGGLASWLQTQIEAEVNTQKKLA